MLPVLRCRAAGVEAPCYHSTPAQLRLQKAVLPSGRPWYQRCPLVLPAMSACATSDVRRSYHCRRWCYQRWLSVLRQAVATFGGGGATSGGCRCCHKPLLPLASAVLPSVVVGSATSRKHCYHLLAAML